MSETTSSKGCDSNLAEAQNLLGQEYKLQGYHNNQQHGLQRLFNRDRIQRMIPAPIRNAWLVHMVFITLHAGILLIVLYILASRNSSSLARDHGDLDNGSPLAPAFRYNREYVHYGSKKDNSFLSESLEEVDTAWLNLLNRRKFLKNTIIGKT